MVESPTKPSVRHPLRRRDVFAICDSRNDGSGGVLLEVSVDFDLFSVCISHFSFMYVHNSRLFL
jgi:hypothetical protein